MGPLLLVALVAFVLSVIIVRILWSDRFADMVVDIPNHRSLHAHPTPRTGGLGLMLAAAIALVLFGTEPRVVVFLAMLLTAIFFIDDIHGLSVIRRFAAQFVVAIWFVAMTGPYPWLLWPPLVLGIVWSANLYNFMDGSNGLAGGMAVIGFAAYAIAAWQTGANDLAILSAVVSGAAAGFLVWNFNPARIFLGDAGSIPLGFLAAAIGVLGWQRGLWPFWFPALIFAAFIVDSGLTLVKRLLHRENPFEAHRSHYYQRLIRMGWSHRRLALNAYLLMALTALSALWLRTAPPLGAGIALLLWAGAIALVVAKVDARWYESAARREALEQKA